MDHVTHAMRYDYRKNIVIECNQSGMGKEEWMRIHIGFKYYNAAVRIGESFMDYYTNDNTGSRYYLMHLYACLEKMQNGIFVRKRTIVITNSEK